MKKYQFAILNICLVTLSPYVASSSRAGEARRTGESPTVVARGRGISVSANTLDELVATKLQRLKAEEYRLKRAALEQHLATLLMKNEAAARKTTVTELERLEIDTKAAPVSEEDVNTNYEKSRERFRNRPEAEARKEVETSLRQVNLKRRRAEYERELRSRADIQVLLEPPRISVAVGDDPARGPENAPVTIVEFSDFQCPYCSRVNPVLKRIEERNPGKLRVVFRDFPLPFHKEAGKAAEAASCANEQGRFWPMHDVLFANQKNLSAEDLKRYASELGLDQQAFAQCVDAGRHTAEWQQDRSDGESYGVSSTPTLFVNGRLLVGANEEALVEVVEEELQRVEKLQPAKVAAKRDAP